MSKNRRKIKIEHYGKNGNDKNHKKYSLNYYRNIKLTIVSIFLVLIVMLSSSYAIFSSVQKSEKYNTLSIGTLKVDFTDTEEGMGNIIKLNGEYPESDADGLQESPYTFKITNTGTLNASYKIKIVDDQEMIAEDGCSSNLLDKSKIRVSINSKTPITLSTTQSSGYVVEEGILDTGKSKNYEVRIWIDNNSGNEVLGKHYHGKIVVETVNTKESEAANTHIKAVYRYNQDGTGTGTEYTGCLGGTEAGCTDIVSTIDNDTEYNAGDIVKYEVAPGVEKYFNVLYDNGTTLTLQQRENTVYNTAWYAASKDNTQGPTTILPALENATSGWSYVNDLNYTMGVDTFGTDTFATAHTACTFAGESYPDSTTCTGDKYASFTKTNVKARLITAGEAGEMGCKMGTSNSCKRFMNNYLYNSTSYGGSKVDDTVENGTSHNYGYWTASARAGGTYNVLYVRNDGSVSFNDPTYAIGGARAVVVVDK